MIVKNPTNSAIEVQIKGIRYEIAANSSISNVPEEHASYWQTSLHNFVIVTDDEVTPVVKTADLKEEVKAPEVTKEEAKEEAPVIVDAAPEVKTPEVKTTPAPKAK